MLVAIITETRSYRYVFLSLDRIASENKYEQTTDVTKIHMILMYSTQDLITDSSIDCVVNSVSIGIKLIKDLN